MQGLIKKFKIRVLSMQGLRTFALSQHPLQRVKAKCNSDFRFGGKSAAASESFSRSFKKPFVFSCFEYFPGYFRHFF